MKPEKEILRFSKSLLLNTTIATNHHIAIEERVDSNGIPFVILCNFYLQQYELFDNFQQCLLYLSHTTYQYLEHQDSYLNDVAFLVDRFGEKRSFYEGK